MYVANQETDVSQHHFFFWNLFFLDLEQTKAAAAMYVANQVQKKNGVER
jgi:hypothetical protein